jgi:hypothetical protein
MRVDMKNARKEKGGPSKLIKITLFWSIFLFIVFLSKRIISFPTGNIDFLVKNLLSFICALITTAIMIHFLKERAIKISIFIVWFVTILLIL